MRKKQSDRKKMVLAKETLAPLEAQNLNGVIGAVNICPQESRQICSIQHTCVSCNTTLA
jgi:hypothetical protein